MGFKRMLRRFAGAAAAVAAVGAMLIAPASAAPAPDGEVGILAIYNIKHPNTGKCLEATPDLAVRLWDCDDTVEQQWNNDQLGRFRNGRFAPKPGGCLASNGTNVFILECGTRSSLWKTSTTNPKLVSLEDEPTKCLHTNSGVAGRFAYLNTCTDSTRWVFTLA